MRKIIFFIICFIFIFICSGCNNHEINHDEEQYQIFILAKEAGFSGTYEEWLSSIKGEKGEDGKSAYEIFKKHYPEYSGTEEEWITAVAKGDKCKLFDHIWDEGIIIKEPVTGADGQKLFTCNICKEERIETIEGFAPTNINVHSLVNECLLGYMIYLSVEVYPSDAIQSVYFEISDPSVASIDENYNLMGLKVGTVEIKVISTVSDKIYDTIEIEVVNPGTPVPIPNMGGYEIVIMAPSDILKEIDPFLEDYSKSDKIFKQKAWNEVEINYNCKIVVKPFPSNLDTEEKLMAWINDNASKNSSQCDLAFIPSYLIDDFATSGAALDTTEYFNIYCNKKNIEKSLKEAGTYDNKIYISTFGSTQNNIYVDNGLFYNIEILKSLGVKDPAQMFNEGQWTYNAFTLWVKDIQSKLGNDKYVLGGNPYNYYYGLTNAVGVKIYDATSLETNINSIESKKACELIKKLVNDGCFDKNISIENLKNGTTLMTVGTLSDILNDSSDFKYGYVPFPYPDDFKKEDTKVGVTKINVLMYVNGRVYPESLSSKYVYRAINQMFISSANYENALPSYDPTVIKENILKEKITNQASIEAILYYDSNKAFYEAIELLNKINLENKIIEVIYNNKDFDEVFLLP